MSEARDFYVSLIRGKRYALMAGPFATHDEAKKFVDPVRREASRLDPFSDFDAFGTCSLPHKPDNRLGWLNVYVGVKASAVSGDRTDADAKTVAR